MTATRHLLAVNFRDPAHPEAGGAELHLEEILLEALRRGMRVTWLASGFPARRPTRTIAASASCGAAPGGTSTSSSRAC